MRPFTAQVRVYRPRQVMFGLDKFGHKQQGLRRPAAIQYKRLGLMMMAAIVIGLGFTQIIHVRVTDLRGKADHLQVSYSVFADENKRLMATEAQLASKTQVVELAKRKLKLFEPDQGQVRRM